MFATCRRGGDNKRERGGGEKCLAFSDARQGKTRSEQKKRGGRHSLSSQDTIGKELSQHTYFRKRESGKP